MLVLTTTGRGQCVMYYLCTKNISTVSYQYLYYLFYCKIHLPRLILCYCTSIYFINTILSCFICNHPRTLLFSQILNQSLSDIFRNNFCCIQINTNLSKAPITPTQLTLKDEALSGVGKSWWGRSRLWYKSPGFR